MSLLNGEKRGGVNTHIKMDRPNSAFVIWYRESKASQPDDNVGKDIKLPEDYNVYILIVRNMSAEARASIISEILFDLANGKYQHGIHIIG